jgi:hypothetical protein
VCPAAGDPVWKRTAQAATLEFWLAANEAKKELCLSNEELKAKSEVRRIAPIARR